MYRYYRYRITYCASKQIYPYISNFEPNQYKSLHVSIQSSQTKVKIAGRDARKRKVNVNGVGQKDGVADQVGKETDVMEAWELKEWDTYVPAKKVTIDFKYFYLNVHSIVHPRYVYI